MSDDLKRVQRLIENTPYSSRLEENDDGGDPVHMAANSEPAIVSGMAKDDPRSVLHGQKIQWSTSDDQHFTAVGTTYQTLPAGAYMIQTCQGVLIYKKFKIRTEGLIRFPETISDEVIEEMEKFWERPERFKKYNLPHKRGVLIIGPAGVGKSCTIQIICSGVVKRGGIILPFTDPGLLMAGIDEIRQIQPETPIIVLMEDLEVLMKRGSRSEILNMLDGVYSDAMYKVVFLGTTNNPEELERRLTNRPNRFDRVFMVTFPSPESRRLFLSSLVMGDWEAETKVPLDKVVEDTDCFSFASLVELFRAIVVFDNPYEKVLERLRQQIQQQLPTGDEMEFQNLKGQMGYGQPPGQLRRARLNGN